MIEKRRAFLLPLPCLFRALQSPPGSLSKGKKEDKEEVWQECETSLLVRYNSGAQI